MDTGARALKGFKLHDYSHFPRFPRVPLEPLPPNPIHTDPLIVKLLEKVPATMRESFSVDQLLALKVALGGRTWGAHALDARWTLKLWRWQYYFVVLAGRNRRSLTQRQRQVQRLSLANFLALFLLLSTAVGLVVLYLVKSALGIDLLPGFSLGLWGWFQETVLR